jgi:hypothetical protein
MKPSCSDKGITAAFITILDVIGDDNLSSIGYNFEFRSNRFKFIKLQQLGLKIICMWVE